MGLSITNENIDELLTSQIDGENKDVEMSSKINEMLQNESTLMKKYKSELLTKQLYKNILKPVEVPSSTYMKIIASIDQLVLDAAHSRNIRQYTLHANANFFQYLINVLTSPLRIGRVVVPAYSLSIIIILIIAGVGFFVNRQNGTLLNPYIVSGSEKSVMVQAVNNFNRVLSGEIKPQLQSNDANEVKRYIKDKVSFDPYVPKINEYILLGAVCNEYNGQNLVHLIYTSGDDILYIYETASNSLNHKNLELPDQVSAEILREKYYMCDNIDYTDCTMTLWYTGNVLCASVTTMPKQKMYSTFTGFYK